MPPDGHLGRALLTIGFRSHLARELLTIGFRRHSVGAPLTLELDRHGHCLLLSLTGIGCTMD